MSGYPSTSGALRARLEAIIPLSDDAPQWLRLTREDLRMPGWLLPAVQVAVRERVWDIPGDPAVAIIGRVHKLGIAMRLNNGDRAVEEPESSDES